MPDRSDPPDRAPGPTAPSATAARPLLVTGDPDLLDELLRLAAAAGVEAQVAHDVTAARPGWTVAPLVVVGADLAADAARADLPHRRSVVLVGRDGGGAGLWEHAAPLHADGVGTLPSAQEWVVDRLGDAVAGPDGAGLVVAVVGGRGGAGASTLAAALAVTAAREDRLAMLVDADPLGGGIDLVLGGEDAVGLRWPDLAGAGGRMSGPVLRESLPRADTARTLSVLSWGRGDALTVPARAMRSVLTAARRSSDVVVVDLPRRPDAAAELVLTAATRTLLLVPAEVRATASAARVAVAVGLLTSDLQVVVRGPAPSGLTGPLVAEALALPLAGWLRAEPGLVRAQERGEPPARTGRGPLARLCRGLLADLDRPGGRSAA